MLKVWKRTAAAALACVVFSVGFAGVAEAALKNETRTAIESVSVSIQSDVRAEYDTEAATVYVTANSSLYTIGAYEWVGNKKEYWEPGDLPKVKIEIHARSGYYFKKVTGASKFQITGGTYSSVKPRNNNETLLLTVTLTPASGTLEMPDSAEWVGYPVGKASWEPVLYAGAYELKLYCDGQPVGSIPKVNATLFDFYPYMTRAGRYQFKVRAIPKDSQEETYITSGEWTWSDECDIDSDQLLNMGGRGEAAGPSGGGNSGNSGFTPAQLGWVKDQEGWWYRNVDGSYPKGTWQVIGGAWYLFDYDGYMMTGWQVKNGRYYYLDANGVMQTGWLFDGRKWYYLGNDGAMMTGWLTTDGNTYYMDGDGSMHTGWLLDNGKWYYFNPDTGCQLKNTSVGGFYLNQDGVWVY